MGEFLSSVWKSIREYFARLTRKERVRLAVLAVVIVALAAGIAVALGHVTYDVLYSGLSAKDAGDVAIALEELQVSYKTEGAGTILVPKDQLYDVRNRLASSGAVSSGALSYDIFAQASGFGMTDLEKRQYLIYQEQDHIRTVLLGMDKIEECQVLLNIPPETSFVLSSNKQEASATISVTLRSGTVLTPAEANAVAGVAVTAVAGLKLENITLVDTAANLYKLGIDAENQDGAVSENMLLEQQLRLDLEGAVLALLSPVFGPAHIKVGVDVQLNFDDVISEEITFAAPIPGSEEGLAVSASELHERTRYADAAEGVPGTDSNGMGTAEYPYGTLAEDELYSKDLLEHNYELNKTTTQIKKEKGTISFLSVSVLVDSAAVSEDYTDEVRDLVSNAIGISDSRLITVSRLPFQSADNAISDMMEAQNEFLEAMKLRDMQKTAIICATALILLLMLILLVRLLVRGASSREPQLALAGIGADDEGIDYLVGGDEDPSDLLPDLPSIDLLPDGASENLDDLKRLVEKDPDSVVQLLRNWLIED